MKHPFTDEEVEAVADAIDSYNQPDSDLAGDPAACVEAIILWVQAALTAVRPDLYRKEG